MTYRERVVQLITNAHQLPPRAVIRFLMPNERVVIAVRMHPAAIIGSLLLILGGASLAGFVTAVAHGKGGLVLAIWLLWGLLFVWQGWKVATWWRRYFAVTENRLMLVTNLLFTNVAMMPLPKMTELRLRESIFGRMLGYGDFIVESAGPQQTLSHVRFVPHPARMYLDILSLSFPNWSAAAGPQEPPVPRGRAQGPSGPSWPGSPSRRSGGSSERPGDDPGF